MTELFGSVDEFVAWSHELQERWYGADTSSGGFHHRVLFRGQRRPWDLLPSLYRVEATPEDKSIFDLEARLFTRFRNEALPYIDQPPGRGRDWEWYAIMQHHGTPTRLLDFTESLVYAIYFAVRDATPEDEPRVWALNWGKMNEISLGEAGRPPIDSLDVGEYKPLSRDERDGSRLPEGPVVGEIPYVHPRIAAQQGRFCVFGKDQRPLTDQPAAQAIEEIAIEPSSIPAIHTELSIIGITETAVFPDLEGLSHELRDRYTTER